MRGTSVTVRDAQPISASSETAAAQGVFSGVIAKVDAVRQDPQVQQKEGEGGSGVVQRTIIQLIYGVNYYFLIVSKYPVLRKEYMTEAPEPARQLQNMNA